MPLDVSQLPESLAAAAEQAWQHILERAEEPLAARLGEAVDAAGMQAELARVLACSVFAVDQFRSRGELLLQLVESGQLHEQLPETFFAEDLRQRLAGQEDDLLQVLRRYRQWHMLRIVWRDLCRLSDTRQTVRDTSLLAEAAIAEALVQVEAELEPRFGQPCSASGERQQLIVLAMGKLGARELNVSSDIDLVFAFPAAGETRGGERSLSNEEFFTRVGRGLITALDQLTADGFVFRVDMRLRPYGESGALVHSFNALETYYQDQGRDWERYALIKARPVTGSARVAGELMAMLRPFVYRKYVDFGVIESLRGMKQMISAEVRRRGLENNVKLGHGGIREVEFIAQCFQLIRGGRDLGLQQRELLAVLPECETLGILPSSVVTELVAAYLFLRDCEHAIQAYQDKQTQELPLEGRPRQALATVMGCADWESFSALLDEHRGRVAGHFAALIAPAEEEFVTPQAVPSWDEVAGPQALAELGFRDPEASLATLEALRQNGRVMTLQAAGRERLEHFMPLLLGACAEARDPDLSLERVLPLVLAVVRRSAYLVLLMENPPALVELVTLCGASPWIAEQMARNPVLLDELLDRASLYTAPDKTLLQEDLRQQVTRLAIEDLEAQMDALRYFKAAHVLRVAASELVGRLPLMQVSDKLTLIAEVILDQVLAVAWEDMVRKHGEPARATAGMGFAVYAYGKLGGIELSYGSDLDLVFICDSAKSGVTDGERSIDNAVFYTRLAQRMIHIMQARMTMGQLYEVDLRLRPSGDSGMLVISVDGFRSYQQESAWTWEHQALVRARFVAGDEALAERVDDVRREVLCQPREAPALAREVVAMRDRMRKHLLPQAALAEGEFHLKQGAGGIVDIEFMVQYAVLAWSHREPELARWSDNMRILETLCREGFFEQRDGDALREAYLAFRSAAHQLSLQQQPDTVSADEFVGERAAVIKKWRELFAPYEQDTPSE